MKLKEIRYDLAALRNKNNVRIRFVKVVKKRNHLVMRTFHVSLERTSQPIVLSCRVKSLVSAQHFTFFVTDHCPQYSYYTIVLLKMFVISEKEHAGTVEHILCDCERWHILLEPFKRLPK